MPGQKSLSSSFFPDLGFFHGQIIVYNLELPSKTALP